MKKMMRAALQLLICPEWHEQKAASAWNQNVPMKGSFFPPFSGDAVVSKAVLTAIKGDYFDTK